MPASDWLTHAVPLDDFDVDALLEREWLCTNGTGAYAMGTAAACNTRRYHGLFVAATHPPVGRVVALNQVLEQLVIQRDGKLAEARGPVQTLDLSTCLFYDQRTGERMLEPHGWSMLRRFDRRISVQWIYGYGRLGVRRELRLHWKQQAATIRYRITGLHKVSSSATLKLSPMMTLRDFHGLFTRSEFGDPPIRTRVHEKHSDAVVASNGWVDVSLSVPGSKFIKEPQWWYNLRYPVDAQRGQGDREDHWVPGRFEVALPASPKVDVTLTVALGTEPVEPVVQSDERAKHLRPMLDRLQAQFQRGQAIVPATYGGVNDEEDEFVDEELPPTVPDRMVRSLTLAADDFVVDRTLKGEKLSTILAGFPWFADWGRDTFIALPGLLLCTGRYDEARGVLKTFAGSIRRGLVPNRFDDYDESAAHYNTVDGSLWYVHAALEYLRHTGDRESWDAWLGAACRSILDAYAQGTDNDIRMDADGLITAGHAGTQLTWMDAAAVDEGGRYTVFTPRHGKAVEINALWYSGLAGMAEVDQAQGSKWADLAERVKTSFARVFWNDALGCCYDHVYRGADGSEQADASVRPNQAFAAALARSPLSDAQRVKVVRAVSKHLATPVGLRTLPESDPHYHADYAGPQFGRDEAYHQGTVWPWLIGPFAEAVLRIGWFSDDAKGQAWGIICPLVDRALGDGLGQLHEIHEAKPPHAPRGCVAQAWSLAEVLRVLTLIQTGE